MKRDLLILAVVALLTACQASGPEPVDMAFLERYVRDPKNGLERTREVAGFRSTVRLLPPGLGALRKHNAAPDSCGPALHDLVRDQKKQLSFILNIAPDGETITGDVMYADVSSVEAFKERAYDLNFPLEDRIELRCGTKLYTPVLSTLENTYGITKDRNLIIVFVPSEADDTVFYTSEYMDLVVRDHWFGTGTQHFKFLRTDLKRTPEPSV